uniref:MARVEL domain-containing protein n=1 Tax=Panagrellus redivivus TaxID=6233 RepID=A0A7E4VFP4_PANRE
MCFMPFTTDKKISVLCFCCVAVSVFIILGVLTSLYAFILIGTSFTQDLAVLSIFFFAVCFVFQLLSLAFSIRSAVNDDFDVIMNCFLSTSVSCCAAGCFITIYALLFFGSAITGFISSLKLVDSGSPDACSLDAELNCDCGILVSAFFFALLSMILRIFGMKPIHQHTHEKISTKDDDVEAEKLQSPYLLKPDAPKIMIKSVEEAVKIPSK